MTREEKYADWLVKNQDKRGTPEFDTVASAYKQLRSAPAAPTPQDDRGTIFDPIAQGATLGFSDEMAGLVGGAMNLMRGKSFGEGYRGTRDVAREQAQAYRERQPATALAAEMGGGLLTGGVGGGRALAGATGRQLAARGAATGAGLGAVQGLGYTEADSLGDIAKDVGAGATIGGLFGGAGGAMAGKLASRAAQRADEAASDVYQRQVKVLEDAGIPLTGGQKSGQNWVKTAEGTLAAAPFTGTPLQRAAENQQRAYQKKLFDLIGVKNIPDDGMLTKEAIEETSRQLSEQYANALKDKMVNISDDEFLEGLAAFEQRFKNFAGEELTKPAKTIVDDLLDEAVNKGAITGDTYQKIRSQFARRAKGTSPTAEVYDEAKKLLDDAFARAAGKEVKGNLDARYAQFAQLRNYFDSVKGGAAGAEGYIAPGTLARMAGKNPGSKEWREFTRAAASVIPQRLGDSGTAQRSYIMRALENPLVAVGGLGYIDPSFAGGALLGRGMSSQLAKGRYPDIEGLLTPRFESLAPRAIGAGTGVTAGILGGQ